LELARHLTRAGVGVTIVTTPPTREPQWHEPGIELRIVDAPRLALTGIPDRIVNYPRWMQAAGNLIATLPVDLVHAQGLGGWGYARQLQKTRAHAPLVINTQGMEEFKAFTAKRAAFFPLHLMARNAAKSASALIASDTP